MKKVLYISASSKPDDLSASKTIANELIEKLKDSTDDELIITHLDLYEENLPLPTYKYFTKRASIVTGPQYDQLSANEKKDVDRMVKLCDQFLDNDIYIISTPMWSISFPSILKQYLDIIMQTDKVIYISDKQVKGLLDDKVRKMVYIQSSGGDYPALLSRITNHGYTYMKDLFGFLGIKDFMPVLIEGTEQSDIGIEKAMKKARTEMENVLEKLVK